MSDWQPIETAPEEGRFLVSGGQRITEIWGEMEPEPNQVWLVERTASGAFAVADGECYTTYIDAPTLWAPVPPLPPNNPIDTPSDLE